MNTIATPARKRTAKAITPPSFTFHLPSAMAEKLRMMAKVAGIAGGAETVISSIIGDLIENQTLSDILIDGWEITDPATIANLYEI